MSCSLRVFIVDDDPVGGGGADLRVVLARTRNGPHEPEPGKTGVEPVRAVTARWQGLVRDAAYRPNGETAGVGPAVSGGPVTALIVDDRADVLAALSGYFTRSSCTVMSAAEADELDAISFYLAATGVPYPGRSLLR